MSRFSRFQSLLAVSIPALLAVSAFTAVSAEEAKYPHAYPRSGVTKLFENERGIAWNVNWIEGVEQPYHLHRYDMAGVYLRWGPIRITEIDGNVFPQRPPFEIPFLYFQRKVHAAYRNVVGAEALMRWHHPEQGVLPPSAFLSSIKKGGLLEQLTWFAIKAAIAQCRRWPEEVHVAVNIPPAVLLSAQLESVLRDAFAIFSLPPQRVTLEVTEDAVIADPARALQTLDALRRLGVRLSIDDFGTGYSSFAYLRELPVDELKIDRAFVQELGSDRKNRGIVKAVVELAHGLGLKVVAEGVEDAETAEILQRMGCDLLQGYWFGKPVPHEQFLSDLQKR